MGFQITGAMKAQRERHAMVNRVIRQLVVHVVCLVGLWPGFGAWAQSPDTVTYVYTDPQGTPLAEADAQGNVVARYDYAPYGTPVASLGNPPNGLGYTGHVDDPDTGLVYMQARYYDPVVGRFLSIDPSDADIGSVFFFGRYTYVEDNPIANIDPDGRETVLATKNQVTVIQTFHNNGVQFSDKQISAQASNLSGRASDGRMIVVILVPGNDRDAVQLNPNAKLNDLSKKGEDRSHIDRIGGRDVQVAPNAQSPGTIGHEIAHALRAGDQYKGGIDANGKKLSKDVPGPTNIMKNAVGVANLQTLNEIEKGTKTH